MTGPRLDYNEVRGRIFSSGCDARIAGQTPDVNPYDFRGSNVEYKLWEQGWWQAHNEWGRDARWPYNPLPEVALGFAGEPAKLLHRGSDNDAGQEEVA